MSYLVVSFFIFPILTKLSKESSFKSDITSRPDGPAVISLLKWSTLLSTYVNVNYPLSDNVASDFFPLVALQVNISDSYFTFYNSSYILSAIESD
jgi:hypothetical protein